MSKHEYDKMTYDSISSIPELNTTPNFNNNTIVNIYNSNSCNNCHKFLCIGCSRKVPQAKPDQKKNSDENIYIKKNSSLYYDAISKYFCTNYKY